MAHAVVKSRLLCVALCIIENRLGSRADLGAVAVNHHHGSKLINCTLYA